MPQVPGRRPEPGEPESPRLAARSVGPFLGRSSAQSWPLSDPELEDGKKPTCTIEEIPGYVWDVPKEGTAAAEKPPKEEPRKADDHGMDAMRYMAAYLDLQARPRVRFL